MLSFSNENDPINSRISLEITPDSAKDLIKNINKYNTNGVIISISHDVMKYFKSNATEGHLTKESFRKAIKRLRENPPK